MSKIKGLYRPATGSLALVVLVITIYHWPSRTSVAQEPIPTVIVEQSANKHPNMASNAPAATITVNSSADGAPANNGQCTLREAIINANNNNQSGSNDCAAGSGVDAINFSITGVINLTSVLPNITGSLTISGPGASSLTIRRASGGDYRIFFIPNSGLSISFSGLTIRDGRESGFGGGISSFSNLTLTDCVITNNETTGTEGCCGAGVALLFNSGTFTNCTFSNNKGGQGSGINFEGTGGHTLTLVNCTISGNTNPTGFNEGIINASQSGASTLQITNSTIANNSSGVNQGSGVRTTSINSGSIATTILRNTIIANNTLPNLFAYPNPGATVNITSLGNNLTGDNGSGFLTQPTDKINTNPLLGPLADNGGQKPTHALLPGSPAIDAGASTGAPATDQRGVARPQGPAFDIGAFEASNLPPPSITSISPGSPAASSNNQNITVFGSNFQPGLTVRITFPNGGSTVLSGTQIQNITSTSFVMVATLNAIGSWSIHVDNPDGGQSNIFGFNTISQQSAPFISSIAPSIPVAGGDNQNISVFGSNFQAGLTVRITFPNGNSTTLSGAQIQNATSSSFVMVATLGAPGTWSIRVNNPNGGQSNTFSFTVAPPSGVTISSISPSTPIRSSVDQPITVNGSNFQPGLTVTVTFPSGSGVTLSGTQIQSVTANSFVMLATLNATGAWYIRVNNPGGIQSNPFSFNVQSGPTISYIIPVSPIMSSTDQPVTVRGVNFQPGLTVSVTFPNGQGTILSGTQIQNVTSSSFVMLITLNVTGNWTIRINFNGIQSNPYSFAVGAPAPSITNITPSTVTAGQTTMLTVVGSNFQNNFSASVATQDGIFQIASANLFFDSSNQVRARIRVLGMPPYQATLKITNPDGQNAIRSFSVAGSAITPTGLTGQISIVDEQGEWKLNGDGVVSLDVYASPISNSSILYFADVQDSQYSFSNLPSGTIYNLTVVLRYVDVVNINNVINPGPGQQGCEGATLIKTTRLRINNVSAPSSQPYNIKFYPPIVMVHGILSCYQKWYSDVEGDIGSWDNYARDNGFIVFTPNYHFFGASSSWPSRADEVKNQIESNFRNLTKKANGSYYPQWYYIAHSMGGLVARVLTSGNHRNSALIRSLKKFYLLGTPNSGTNIPLSNVAGLSEYDIRGTFNQSDARRGSFPDFGEKLVSVYAGNNGFGWATSNDKVVPVESVGNIFKASCSMVVRITFGGAKLVPECSNNMLAAKLPLLPDTGRKYDHFDLGSPASRYELLFQRILPEICTLSGTSCNSLSPGPSFVSNSISSMTGPIVFLRDIGLRTRSLDSNQIDTWAFRVTLTDLLVINVGSSIGSAAFSLINPAGQVVNFSTLPPAEGEHIVNQLGESFILYNPVPGSWTLQTTASPSGVEIAAKAMENSPLGFEGFVASQSVLIGQSTLLLGHWVGDSSGISSPSITAQIMDETGNIISTTTLYDDGDHQDGAASDGIFAAEAPAFLNNGRYTVAFTSQGTQNGQVFTRRAESSVDVLVSTHFFTKSFNDIAIDSDANGTYDTLRATAGVSVPAVGSYLVTADLQDTQGYHLDHTVGYLQAISDGVYALNLDFRMSGTSCGQFNAPFSIKNLTLSDAGTLKVLDIYADDVLTQTYNGSLFGCATGVPAPIITSLQPSSMFPGTSGQVIVNGKSFAEGAQVSFGSDVTVSSVAYGGSTTLLAQISIGANAAPGLRDITVTNPDGRSSTTSGIFSIASDQPPIVSIANVVNQQNLTGQVIVSASASDDRGIQKVEFSLDGALVGTDTSFPYQFVWDTAASTIGAHALQAKAYDIIGQTGVAQVTVNTNCNYSISPTDQSFNASGGAGVVNVFCSNSCGWVARSNVSWITISSGAAGSGNGAVGYSVAANPGPVRTGAVTIAGQTFTVSQTACPSITISPATIPPGTVGSTYSQTFTQSGGAGAVTFSVSAGSLPNGLDLSPSGVLSGAPTESGSFNFTVRATDANNCFGEAAYPLFITGSGGTGLQYYPLPHPIRLLDTRPGATACSTPGSPLQAGTPLTQQARVNCDGVLIPANAQAVVGNATVVNFISGAGFITLWPTGASQPTVSNLNYLSNQIIPNAFTVGLNGNGEFNLFASSTTNIIVDITGYYAPPGAGGLYYHPLPTPIRLLDTRTGATACTTPGTPLQGGAPLTQNARLTCNGVTIPNNAQAVVGNGTVVNFLSGPGFITLWPTGASQPTVSNLNYLTNQIIPNAFTVGLGPGGNFEIFASSTTHFIADITGYYSNDPAADANGVAGLLYNPLPSPIRLLDTRQGATACTTPGLPLQGGAAITQQARVSCNNISIPGNAAAIVGNGTVVNFISGAGFITLWPTGAAQPTVSNMNYLSNQIIPNAFTVGLSVNGQFNIFASSSTHFIADVTGYFAP